MQIRQGDVLLERIDEPLEKSRKLDGNGHPLAGLLVEGERTGHAHRLPSRVYDAAGDTVLMLERPTALTHEEHRHIEVPAGWYRVIIQREHVAAAETRRRYD